MQAPGVSRRDLLRFGGLAAVGASALVAAPGSFAAAPAAAAPGAQWAGHVPGKVFLGVSAVNTDERTLNRIGPVGLRRTYFRWNEAARETRVIRADHAAGRLPWISFKPPTTARGGWAAIARGQHDADIRARSRRYAALRGPVVATFHHEPSNDNTGTPAEFANAWTRIHDLMDRETGLKNVAHVPIIGDWAFNPMNKREDHRDWATPAVLDRCAFLGIDLYQNRSGAGYAERLGRILSWLDASGHPRKMVGLGETGATDSFRSPSGPQWWRESWSWAVANSDRIGAISYFNSQRNNNNGHNWLLTETSAKLSAYRNSLNSPTSTSLA